MRQMLYCAGSFDSHQQKNNLVFHGIEPDQMEKNMAGVRADQHGLKELKQSPALPDPPRSRISAGTSWRRG